MSKRHAVHGMLCNCVSEWWFVFMPGLSQNGGYRCIVLYVVLYRKFSEWPKYKLQGPLEKQIN